MARIRITMGVTYIVRDLGEGGVEKLFSKKEIQYCAMERQMGE